MRECKEKPLPQSANRQMPTPNLDLISKERNKVFFYSILGFLKDFPKRMAADDRWSHLAEY